VNLYIKASRYIHLTKLKCLMFLNGGSICYCLVRYLNMSHCIR